MVQTATAEQFGGLCCHDQYRKFCATCTPPKRVWPKQEPRPRAGSDPHEWTQREDEELMRLPGSFSIPFDPKVSLAGRKAIAERLDISDAAVYKRWMEVIGEAGRRSWARGTSVYSQ